jgi:hypothetical protein
MITWIQKLNYDALPSLLNSQNPSIPYFTKRDIKHKKTLPISAIWELPIVTNRLKNQQKDGSWKFLGQKRNLYPPHHYQLVETWKQLRILIQDYQLTNEQIQIKHGCEFLFRCQTTKGDIRGMIGNQYATYYTGAMLGILIKAGYQNHPGVIKGLNWLLSMRQDDGGWTIPLITHSFNRKTQYKLTSTKTDPVEPDRTKPFSHNWTDMVLRGFAPHPTYRNKPEIIHAAKLLKSQFFKKDAYSSYKASRHWTTFSFWWPNILTSLESLQLCGFKENDSDIKKGLTWFIENQQPNGLWELIYPIPEKISNKKLYLSRQEWLALRILRLLDRYST